MSREDCGNCRFWRKSAHDDRGGIAGYCRRYPPFAPAAWRVYQEAETGGLGLSIETEGARFLNDAWPNTSADAWCGEHAPAAP